MKYCRNNDREMEKKVDYRVVFSVLLTDFSKVFDCIPQELIITRLETYVTATRLEPTTT